jgi:hypothetical protein
MNTAKANLAAREKGYMESEDFYETPVEAVDRFLAKWTPPSKEIWEPSCGAGAISNRLIQHGYRVTSTDLVDRGYGESGVDFFAQTEMRAPVIITNPPYNISTQYVAHACSIAPVSAFLLRLAWLEGRKRRKQVFERFNLSKVFVFSKRIPRMHKPGYEGEKFTSTIPFAWFVFDFAHNGRPEIEWI